MRAHNASDQIQEWWIVNQLDPGPVESIGTKNEPGLNIYVFSDQVSPPSLGFLAGYGYAPTNRNASARVQNGRSVWGREEEEVYCFLHIFSISSIQSPLQKQKQLKHDKLQYKMFQLILTEGNLNEIREI